MGENSDSLNRLKRKTSLPIKVALLLSLYNSSLATNLLIEDIREKSYLRENHEPNRNLTRLGPEILIPFYSVFYNRYE